MGTIKGALSYSRARVYFYNAKEASSVCGVRLEAAVLAWSMESLVGLDCILDKS